MSFKTKATRVLPTYRDLLSDYLGMAQIILGFVTLVLSIAAYSVRAFTSSASSGILAGITLILCGIFGILAGMKKELWAASLYFFQSIIAIIFALVLFGASITAIRYEETRPAPTSVTVRESLDICLICLGLLCGSSCILSLLLTGLELFTDSCKCVKGAKYVEEPNVQYHNEENATSYSNPSVRISNFPGNENNEHVSESVKEQQHGSIHSFENPQINSTNEHQHNLEAETGSAYPI